MNSKKDWGLTVRGVVRKEDKILILRRHPKSRNNPHKWELPGGKVDSGEFFDVALVREFKEETNLDVNVGDFCEAIQNDYPHKRTVQLMMYLDDINGSVEISDEHTQFKWASMDEIRSLELSTSFKKVLKKKNYKL